MPNRKKVDNIKNINKYANKHLSLELKTNEVQEHD